MRFPVAFPRIGENYGFDMLSSEQRENGREGWGDSPRCAGSLGGNTGQGRERVAPFPLF
jgi:hypothetical protein